MSAPDSDPLSAGLSAFDAERAGSMASEGGRSAQHVDARVPPRKGPHSSRLRWLALSVAAFAVLAGYRRFRQSH